MKLHLHPFNTAPLLGKLSVAIGNFDVLHLGHARVVQAAVQQGLPTAMISFTPHPRRFFRPEGPVFELMNQVEKTDIVQSWGIQALYHIDFTSDFSQMSGDDFIRLHLTRQLQVGHITVGDDFCFGTKRQYQAQDLIRFGRELGFGVSIVPALSDAIGPISSTRIRRALQAGQMQQITDLLGRFYTKRGVIEKGDQRGRNLGFPTANIALDPLVLAPRFGIYAVWAEVEGRMHPAIASLGTRPMFNGVEPKLEVHVFDFEGDLYGVSMQVHFVAHLRDEQSFPDVASLIAQMQRDCTAARGLLGSTHEQ